MFYRAHLIFMRSRLGNMDELQLGAALGTFERREKEPLPAEMAAVHEIVDRSIFCCMCRTGSFFPTLAVVFQRYCRNPTTLN